MSNKKSVHRQIVEHVKAHLVLEATAEKMNELRDSKDGYSLFLGGFSFHGEGSGPFAQGDDKDPERRAYVVGELRYAGWFRNLEDAEEAGEQAIGPDGYHGLYADNYVIPEAANMRIIG